MQTLPSYREILKIALPMIIGSLSETISSVVDTAFMGQLGTIEMDGMGMANVFLLLIFMVGWSYGRGSQIIISQNLGAEKYGNIGKAFGNSLLFLLLVSILLAIYLHYGSESVLKFIITNPNIHSVSFVIIQIRALGLPFLMTSVVISSLYTGLGQTKILILSQGIAAVSNMILNYCLVFGHFGFPELGFEGSAWATVTSEILGLLVLILALYFDRIKMQAYKIVEGMHLNLEIVKDLNRLATPMFVLHLFSIGSWVYFFALVERMGEKDLAISMVLRQVFMAITIPSFCLANTANTLVGRAVGARKIDFIMPLIKKVIWINYIILISLALCVFLLRSPLIELFTKDQFVIQNITNPLLVLLSAYLFIPASNVLFVSISALGNTRTSLFVESIVIVSYMIYMYVVVNVLHGNLLAAWSSETFYWLMLLIVGSIYYYKWNWKDQIIYLDKNE